MVEPNPIVGEDAAMPKPPLARAALGALAISVLTLEASFARAQSASSTAAPDYGEVVITATRLPRPLRDVPDTVIVVPREEIDRSPAAAADGVLRAVPSAATFRRTPSLVSDPSAQGLNLRGLGPSGVSRSLLLLDGVPVNDPFGGWIYWRSLPRLGIERIEVAPGGGSALYGNYALGGVVQMFSRPIRGSRFEADASAGLYETYAAGARATAGRGAAAAEVEGELMSSAGYVLVPARKRGAIDRAAGSSHGTINGRFEAAPSEDLRLRGRIGYFEESQNGGTRFTTAKVRLLDFSAGLSLGQVQSGTGRLDLAFFGHVQRFGQERAMILADRSAESLGAEQVVPSNDQGLSAVWTSLPLELAGRHTLIAGADARRIHGSADETLHPTSADRAALGQRRIGGEQALGGVFLEDLYSLSDAIHVTAALRFDLWRNQDGSRFLQQVDGSSASERFADRTEQQVSPKIGILVHPIPALGIRALGYRAFRAPTLNELYRPFQAGTILTAANEDLRAESVLGAEAGADLGTERGVSARASFFWNELKGPITNLTLARPLADGARRQRQNLGGATVRGLELALDWRILRRLVAGVAYTFIDSRVFDAGAALNGKRLPQDPVHRGTATLGFDDADLLNATVDVRWIGSQFEDDQNQLSMANVILVSAFVSRRIVGDLEVFAAAENIFDRQYVVGLAGIETLGPPLMLRFGFRLRDRAP